MFKVSPKEEGEPLNRGRAQLHLGLHGRDRRSSALLGQLSNGSRRHFFSRRNLDKFWLTISCPITILQPVP